MNNGETIYHVANPHVPGTLIGEEQTGYPQTAYVVFDQPVGFSGNVQAGLRREWFCNPELLYRTSEEAVRNHNPERANASPH